jgi:methionyl-tRNA formyltransferase
MRGLLPLLVATRLLRTVRCTAPAPKKVVFLGTPPVAARSLELLLEGSRAGRGGGFEVAAVVSQPPARTGRKMKLTPSPVHALAEAEGLRLFTPASAKDDDFLTALAEMQPDLCVTAAYGCFLPQRFLELPTFGTLNIHPSLLPLYRGAAPVQRCLEAGDATTGVSVAFTVLKMDAGPILRQTTRPLAGDEQAPELLMELFETGTGQLLDALPSVWDGSSEQLKTPQDHEQATPAPKVSRDEANLDLSLVSALSAHNRIRGFSGWPGCTCLLQVGDAPPAKAKLLQTRVGDPSCLEGEPSRVVGLAKGGKSLQLVCGDGSLLEVQKLTMPGKKPVDAKSFWNGLKGNEVRWLTAAEAEAAAASD